VTLLPASDDAPADAIAGLDPGTSPAMTISCERNAVWRIVPGKRIGL
jgi:hypothetical protein